MSCSITSDPREFERLAWGFLEARLECNVLATVLAAMLDGPYDDALFGTVLDGDQVVGAAMRTPPRLLLCSPLPAEACEPLLDAWLAADPSLPGVFAVSETAAAVADGWARRTGGTVAVCSQMAWHALEQVTDPRQPGPGALRQAGDADVEQIVAWEHAFAAEADPAHGPSAEQIARRRVAAGRAYVWRDRDEPVCTVGVNPPVAGVVRVGPVYTPPERRRRGYAGAAVAAVSRLMLARGARRCMLATDLANPTSNRLYAEIGYRRFADCDELTFAA